MQARVRAVRVGFKSQQVAVLSLVLQNGLLCLCSIVMAIMFHYNLNVCLHLMVFILLVVLVILLASGANLATVVNTISIEKDWVVVIADGNKDTLAVLNANMRRIDLCCKLLAPALTGVILQHSDPFSTTIIIAAWNIMSFFVELGLLWAVYKLIPTLSVKKLRMSETSPHKTKVISEDVTVEGGYEDEDEIPFISDKDSEKSVEETHGMADELKLKPTRPTKKPYLRRIFFTFTDGWKIYMRQEIAIVGFALATIYLTVLGFSGVTSSYLLTQGLRKDLIGVFQGLGAIFGITGTVLFPFLRKRFGTIRTGLFGFSTQLLFLMFCVVAVIIPSNKNSTASSSGYYSPNCQDYFNLTSVTIVPSSTALPSTLSTLLIQPTPTCTGDLPTQTVDQYASPTPTPCLPEDSDELLPSPSPSPDSSGDSNLSLYLLLTGIVSCRIGLWIFDLAVQQLVQEKVVEEERGVVGGVMNAMNSVMDMMHYVLVILAPHPENFNILTLISFSMVVLGWLLYCIYVRKARGHFFHFRDCAKKLNLSLNLLRSTVGIE